VEPIDSKLENRVQVGVENDWDLRSPANLPDAIENARHGRAGRERALTGELIDHAIRQRIGERNPELENVDPGFFESEREVDSAGQAGVARADVGDECLFIPVPERGETLVDSIWHSR
jgi:hypothetical protein